MVFYMHLISDADDTSIHKTVHSFVNLYFSSCVHTHCTMPVYYMDYIIMSIEHTCNNTSPQVLVLWCKKMMNMYM